MEFLNPDKVVSELHIMPGMQGADFGAGSGYFALSFAKKVGPAGLVTAIDVLDSSLEAIRAKATHLKLRNIFLKKANLELKKSTGLRDNSQDWVFVANVLFQSNLKKEILEEAIRVLKPQGRLFVIEWQKTHFPVSEGMYPIEESALKLLIESLGLKYAGKFNTGTFHYGLMYTK